MIVSDVKIFFSSYSMFLRSFIGFEFELKYMVGFCCFIFYIWSLLESSSTSICPILVGWTSISHISTSSFTGTVFTNAAFSNAAICCTSCSDVSSWCTWYGTTTILWSGSHPYSISGKVVCGVFL